MKTEFLKELGLEQDAIDKIMAENGKDIESAKGDVGEKAAALEAANKTIKELQDTVKKFDGVDVDVLKSDLTALQERYDSDTASLKLNSALDMALIGAKARDTRATRALLDMERIKLDGDKLLGLDEQLSTLQKDKAFLFEAAEEPDSKVKVDTGRKHGTETGAGDAFVDAARKGAGLTDKQ